MIDFHTHILPGIDDGASTLEESLELLETLSRQGVDTVVLTPHYYGRRRNVQTFLNEFERAYGILRDAYRGDIKLVRGAECNISTCANSDFGELKALTIGNTKYLMTELSFEKKWTEEFWERIDNVLLEGLIPVIAHTELYPALRKNWKCAARLVEMGCLLQVNCDSLLDHKSRKLLDDLFENEFVSCLGSDTHNLSSRPPQYLEAAEEIRRRYGADCLAHLQDEMKKLIESKR